MKTIKIYNTLKVTIMTESDVDWTEDAMAYANEIFNAVSEDNIDLAEYADDYHGNSYYKKLHEIRMSVEEYDNKLYGVAICKVDDDWNDEDTEQLKEYLTDQYSDGWGEGLEQREIASWKDEEQQEEYDEEEDEYYTDFYEINVYAYVNFWQSKNFRIMTESELKK